LTLLLNRTEKVKSKSLEWLLYLLLLIGPTQVPRVIFFFDNQSNPSCLPMDKKKLLQCL